MHVRPSMTLVLLLATILVSPVVQAIEEPSSATHLVVLAAPVGHDSLRGIVVDVFRQIRARRRGNQCNTSDQCYAAGPPEQCQRTSRYGFPRVGKN